MPLLYLNCKAAMDKKLSQILPTCQAVAFTADFWTSSGSDPYFGQTLHFIDKEFKLHKIVLACKLAEGRHTAVNIAGFIDRSISVIPGLTGGTTHYCVTDNAAAMIAAIPKAKKVDVGLPCVDHTVNLMVRGANKAIPEIHAAIEECKAFSRRVHSTPLDQQRIRKECWNLRNDSGDPEQVTYREIIRDVDTRWNSTLFLLRSIAKMRPALESLKEGRFEDNDENKTDAKFKSMIPSPLTFQIIEQVIPIMEKVLIISQTLSADQTPTIQLVSFGKFLIVTFIINNFSQFLIVVLLYSTGHSNAP